MSDAQIRENVEAGILTIRFDRPEKKNAFTLAMYEGFRAALARAAQDPAIRVVVLRGSKGVFTAGNDLVDFAQNPPKDTDTPVFQLLLDLAGFAKPIIAAVEGPAVGIGLTMLLHCDLVYTADNAKFVAPFVNLGLVPEGASTLLLPACAGRLLANELLLFGDPFDAQTALRAGVVNAVLPKEELYGHVAERAAALAAKPAASIRASKALLRQAQGDAVSATLLREGEIFMRRLTSPEAAEAFTAFMEKRPADFSAFD